MSRINRLSLFVVISCLCALHACKDKREELTIDYQNGYYPLSIGHYVDYKVDSVTYSYNDTYLRDTARYQLRQLVADTFFDNTGNLNYVLELYRRPDSTADWVFWKKWFVQSDTTRLLLSEDDLKFVKLVFPPKTALSWNGNQYIPNTSVAPYDVFRNWDYHYGTTDSVVSVNGAIFNNAVAVSEVDNESLIEKYLRREIYAKDVGMIYQEWEVLTKNKKIQNDWDTGPEGGFRIRMSVIGHYP